MTGGDGVLYRNEHFDKVRGYFRSGPYNPFLQINPDSRKFFGGTQIVDSGWGEPDYIDTTVTIDGGERAVR